MKWINNPQNRLYLSGAITLFIGLSSSAIVYLSAANSSDSSLGLELEDSKKYLHDLELYGGKANVLAAEIENWFNGLWHGQALAFTIACITICIAGVLFFVAYHWEPDLED